MTSMHLLWRQTFWLFILYSSACFSQTPLSFRILEERSHDPTSFTQGLELQGDTLFESSGLYGRSYIRRFSPNGVIEQQLDVPPHIFAEGLTVLNNRLFLLSWKAQTLFAFNPKTFASLGSFQYSGEGWGLTHNANELIMSDGSEQIHFHSPENFTRTRTIHAHNQWRKFDRINELEFAQGAIWANVWLSNNILKISPQDGTVLAIVSLDSLGKKHNSRPGTTVLNGIAYVPDRNAFWVTGKFWPKKYLVQFTHKEPLHDKP